MSKLRPLLAPRSQDDPRRITITFDGDELAAVDGEPVSAALLRAGILATTRSPKYRRPRGPYCLRGECGGCQVRIGGLPNLRACTTLARAGLVIESQNQWGPTGIDPTPIVDQVFRRGMDHHHLVVRPRLANQAMQRIARTLTGFGTLADPAAIEAEADHHTHRPEVLIVGVGAAGRRAAVVLEDAGVEVLAIDRRDRETLTRVDPGALPRGLVSDTGVFAAYPHEGLWAAASAPLTIDPPRLLTIRPRHVIVATGGRDPLIPLTQNDLPGVVAARGLLELLHRCDAALVAPIVVIGEGARAEALARALGAEIVAANKVVKILGDDAVTGVELEDRRIACRLVALAPTPAATHELAAQAGAALRFDGDGFAVRCDPSGRVSTDAAVPQPWTLWASGDLRGYLGPEAAAADGERVARALLADRRQRAEDRP